MDVELKNLKGVSEFLSGLPEESLVAAKKEIATAFFKADADIKTNTTLKSRSGQLFRSIKTAITGDTIASLSASIYTKSQYSYIQEKGSKDLPGGAIKAKKAYVNVPGGPYLNIPTSSNKTAAGVMRYTAKEVFNRGGYIAKFRGRNRFGVFLDGNLMFVLTQQVIIKPRLHMVESVEDEVPTMLSRIVAAIGED